MKPKMCVEMLKMAFVKSRTSLMSLTISDRFVEPLSDDEMAELMDRQGELQPGTMQSTDGTWNARLMAADALRLPAMRLTSQHCRAVSAVELRSAGCCSPIRTCFFLTNQPTIWTPKGCQSNFYKNFQVQWSPSHTIATFWTMLLAGSSNLTEDTSVRRQLFDLARSEREAPSSRATTRGSSSESNQSRTRMGANPAKGAPSQEPSASRAL